MSQIFAHYNTTEEKTKESYLDLSQKQDFFEGYESDYRNQVHYEDLNDKAQDTFDDDARLLDDAQNSDYDSYHEEDEYITQYIPYVNQTYRTVGDFQFDEAMKKLTNIFHKTARVDEDLRGQQAPATTPHYGVKVHQQLMEEKRRQDAAINLGGVAGESEEWRKFDTHQQKVSFAGAARPNPNLWPASATTPGSPEISSATQRSMFSMLQRNQGELDEETFYRQLEEDENIREKLDDAIQALEQQGVSLHDAHYSQIPKPKSVAITENQWEGLVKRLLQPSRKKLQKIESILREKQEREEADCTYRPKLCEKSLELASGQKSIFDTSRMEDERHEKMLRMETERRKLEEKRSQHNVFKPKINKSSQGIIRGVETFEAWERNKQQKLKTFQESNQQREAEECTFNPSLSERSRKIVARKNFQKSVWDRNYEFEFERMKKLNQLMEEQEQQIQLTPDITDKAKRIKRNEKIGDRLHSLAMETLSRKKQKREELYGMYYHNDESNLLRESLSMSAASPPPSSRSYVREIERSVNRELDYVDDGMVGDTEYDEDDDDLNTSIDMQSARTDRSKKYRKKANVADADRNYFMEPVLDARQAATAPQHDDTHSQVESLMLLEEQSNSTFAFSSVNVDQVRSTLSKYHVFRRQSSGQLGASPA